MGPPLADADGQSVIGTNSSSQVFPNFSVSTRTVIAACLQAIECVKMSGEGASQCNDLSEICHNRGPHPQPSTGLIRVLDLECRVEHILCHAMDTSDSRACKSALSNCRQAAPGTRPLQQHQGSFYKEIFLFSSLFFYRSYWGDGNAGPRHI